MTSVGFIYPGLGAADDFEVAPSLIPDFEVAFYNTDDGDVAHTVDDLLAVGDPALLKAHALKLKAQHPDVSSIIWTCTSGSFVYTWQGAHAQAEAIEEATGLPASSTSLAFAAAIEHLGLSHVAIAATYPSKVAQYFHDFIEDSGTKVTNMVCGEIPSATGAGALSLDEVIEFAKQADTEATECVLIPDTAMHSIQWIGALEQSLRKPVLTANQVSIWEGLRLTGASMPKVPALGRLFAEYR